MKKLSLHDLDLKGKRVLMRVDFNVPMRANGTIVDDARIRQTLPSIEYTLSQGGKLILMSHLGRPNGKKDPKYSLLPCAKHLSSLLHKQVQFVSDCIGEEVETAVSQLQEGQALFLENLRFHLGEQHPTMQPDFAQKLASLGDVYINDAFGASHRKDTSVAVVPSLFDKAAASGFLLEKEASVFSSLLLNPKRPFYVVLGGAKIGTKLNVLKSLLDKIDGLFIGGGMAFNFLKAQSISIGNSIFDEKLLSEAEQLIKACNDKAIKLWLPKDFYITQAFTDQTEVQLATAKEGIKDGWQGMDIGPKTVEEWQSALGNAKTIFWNGPLGVCELPIFAKGTEMLANTIADVPAMTIIGGGDSLATVNRLNLTKKFTHASTGGGAALEFIEHGHLPGIDALSNR